MRLGHSTLALCLSLSLVACGGGGGSSAGGGSGSGGSSSGGGSSGGTTAGCSLSERQDWALQQLQDYYLFPTLLNASVQKSAHASLQSYIDALVAPARAQQRDRYFTYITSIAEENAFYASGSNAGFGVRLVLDSANRLMVSEAFEDAPALAAGIDRGTEILAIGSTSTTLVNVSTLLAQGTLDSALGPQDPGVTRWLRIRTAAGVTSTVSVTKADYDLAPVSNRYGAKVIDDGGRKVGYINLRTFIDTADPALRQAFANFKAQGVTELIVDVRYNGGGLVDIADLMGDLMGNNQVGNVFEKMAFRADLSQNDSTHLFQARTEAIAPTKIAFIGTHGSASASELIMVGMLPYMGNNTALVGTNTYGKPVGQIARDKSACDDRLRVVAFALQNAAGTADYYNGLAPFFPNSCAAGDDLTKPLGDPQEASVRSALDYLAGNACSAITSKLAKPVEKRQLLIPAHPNAAQHEVPGLF